MKLKSFPLLFLMLNLTVNALALEMAGVEIAPEVQVAGETLHLNGAGIRKKFVFVKVYVGSLYTAQKATSTAEVLDMPGAKLIRMDFLYSKVDRKKIIDAFAEGFANNAPQMVATPAARRFLALFRNDFIEGDRVDLEMSEAGTVTVRHNELGLGTIESPELARGILLIYLGDKPADEEMKQGMLGRMN